MAPLDSPIPVSKVVEGPGHLGTITWGWEGWGGLTAAIQPSLPFLLDAFCSCPSRGSRWECLVTSVHCCSGLTLPVRALSSPASGRCLVET